MRLGFLAAASLVATSCGGGDGAGEVTTTTSEPTWCRTVEDFREDWIELHEAWLEREVTYEERDAAQVEMVEDVLDDLPPDIREPFEQLMVGDLGGSDLEAAFSGVLEYEQANCNRGDDANERPVTTTETGPQQTDLQKYCQLARVDFVDYPGGRMQVYEDLVRYAPPEIRAHEALVVGHLADVAGEDAQFEDLDSGPNAVVPDNLMESIDAINAFKEENC